MATIDFERFQLKRVNPFEGLMVDAATWQDAHEYHRCHQRLHNLAAHGSGIVVGLDVIANSPPDGSVIITPGLGIDPDGNVIVVSQPQRYFLKAGTTGTTYLVIQFREIPTGADSGGTSDGQDSRIQEAYRIQERDRLPDEPYVELARVALTGKVETIKDPADPLSPGVSEIDPRYRPRAGVRPQVPLAIAQGVIGSGPPDSRHLAGLSNLANELTQLGLCQARLIGSAPLEVGPPDCSLLYLLLSTSWTPSKQEMANLGYFLSRGGVVLLETCAGTVDSPLNRQAEATFSAVTQQLGLSPSAVKLGHPLLSSRFVFGQPPPGLLGDGPVLEAQGFVFTPRDYGCAWQGGTTDKPLTREVIRGAVEFGVNLVMFAQNRRSRAKGT